MGGRGVKPRIVCVSYTNLYIFICRCFKDFIKKLTFTHEKKTSKSSPINEHSSTGLTFISLDAILVNILDSLCVQVVEVILSFIPNSLSYQLILDNAEILK